MSHNISHMVTFSLHGGKDTPAAKAFLEESANELSAIPGVQQFEVLRQVSSKNEYDYAFSMIFENQKAYDTYNDHPVHQNYVSTRWLKEVSHFQEIDLISYT